MARTRHVIVGGGTAASMPSPRFASTTVGHRRSCWCRLSVPMRAWCCRTTSKARSVNRTFTHSIRPVSARWMSRRIWVGGPPNSTRRPIP